MICFSILTSRLSFALSQEKIAEVGSAESPGLRLRHYDRAVNPGMKEPSEEDAK